MDDGFVGPAAVGEPVLPTALADRVRAYRRASKADATLRAYRADAAAFEAWCAGHGRRHWPASPETVAAYLQHANAIKDHSGAEVL